MKKTNTKSGIHTQTGIKTHGRTFTGVVTSNKMAKTVAVEWERRHYIPKYERYEKRKTVVKAHTEIELEIGDIVVIKETRPLSKTKHFIVIRKVDPTQKKPITKKTESESQKKAEVEEKTKKTATVKKVAKKKATKKETSE